MTAIDTDIHQVDQDVGVLDSNLHESRQPMISAGSWTSVMRIRGRFRFNHRTLPTPTHPSLA